MIYFPLWNTKDDVQQNVQAALFCVMNINWAEGLQKSFPFIVALKFHSPLRIQLFFFVEMCRIRFDIMIINVFISHLHKIWSNMFPQEILELNEI